ncbi:MAG TPA: DsbA family protein [Caulobacteraceae bacterium]|nr:DsbA family protein [Caulobacteraceae bacterium]
MAEQAHLIYFADPMCSWCWGFAPVMAQIRKTWGDELPIRLVMGGLRPGTEKPMTEAAKADTKGHWEHVHEASGQPFDYGFFDREGFVYDTDPAARAVVLVRRSDETLALAYLVRVQGAFYAENRDVTDFDVLTDLAVEFGFDRDAFRAALEDDALKFETWQDYGVSQRAGIRGFPTLIAGPNGDGTYAMVTRGFNAPEVVLPMIGRWLEIRQAS